MATDSTPRTNGKIFKQLNRIRFFAASPNDEYWYTLCASSWSSRGSAVLRGKGPYVFTPIPNLDAEDEPGFIGRGPVTPLYANTIGKQTPKAPVGYASNPTHHWYIHQQVTKGPAEGRLTLNSIRYSDLGSKTIKHKTQLALMLALFTYFYTVYRSRKSETAFKIQVSKIAPFVKNINSSSFQTINLNSKKRGSLLNFYADFLKFKRKNISEEELGLFDFEKAETEGITYKELLDAIHRLGLDFTCVDQEKTSANQSRRIIGSHILEILNQHSMIVPSLFKKHSFSNRLFFYAAIQPGKVNNLLSRGYVFCTKKKDAPSIYDFRNPGTMWWIDKTKWYCYLQIDFKKDSIEFSNIECSSTEKLKNPERLQKAVALISILFATAQLREIEDYRDKRPRVSINKDSQNSSLYERLSRIQNGFEYTLFKSKTLFDRGRFYKLKLPYSQELWGPLNDFFETLGSHGLRYRLLKKEILEIANNWLSLSKKKFGIMISQKRTMGTFIKKELE